MTTTTPVQPLPRGSVRAIARILITGSRAWPAPSLLADTLMDVWHDATQCGYNGILLVHGGADGADILADTWALVHGMSCERHRVDREAWETCAEDCRPSHRRIRRDGTEYCPTAGHRRNQHMVDLGAALVVAFHHANSSGTADCIRRATAAQLPVRRILA